MKKCPYCAEEIQDEAVVCRYCGRDIPPAEVPAGVQTPPPPKKSSDKRIIFILIAVVAVTLVICFFLFSNNDPYRRTPSPGGSYSDSAPLDSREDAWMACKMFIDQQLGIPTSDAQKYTSSNVTPLANDEYKVKVYYAKWDNTYLCDLSHHPNGDWELLDLSVK